MMAQILKQEVYTESGELKHLSNDKIVEQFIKKLEINSESQASQKDCDYRLHKSIKNNR